MAGGIAGVLAKMIRNILFLLLLSGCFVLRAAEEVSAPAAEVLNVLADSAAAIILNGEPVSWGELKKKIPADVKTMLVDDPEQAAKGVRALCRNLVRRGVLKQEIQRLGLTVSAEERKRYMADLQRYLHLKGSQETAESYLQSMGGSRSDKWYEMSGSETMLVARLKENVTAGVAVTEPDREAFLAYVAKSDAEAKRFNERNVEIFDRVTNDVRMESDNGFKAIAREYSDGAEAARGGVFDRTFTRTELAEILGMKEFALAKGENTDILETPTAIRIVRVMDVLPPERPGDPERLKVAQIVFEKRETIGVIAPEKLDELVLENKRDLAFNQYNSELVKSAKIECPLFNSPLF